MCVLECRLCVLGTLKAMPWCLLGAVKVFHWYSLESLITLLKSNTGHSQDVWRRHHTCLRRHNEIFK